MKAGTLQVKFDASYLPRQKAIEILETIAEKLEKEDMLWDELEDALTLIIERKKR